MSTYNFKLMMSENNRSLYNSLFSFSNKSSGLNSTSNLLSGSSFSLGDYSMIQSGSYKKLLTAYYKTQDDTSDDSKKTTDIFENKGYSKYTSVKDDASELNTAAKVLNDRNLYRSKGTDNDGNLKYDRDSIKKAVKSYVNEYNSYIDSASELDAPEILNKTYSMVKETARKENMLKEAGITIGSNNKLSVDEDTLDKADISTLKTLFTGSGSYADNIAGKASESARIANSVAYNSTHASSYTYKGGYSVLGTTNGYMDQFM